MYVFSRHLGVKVTYFEGKKTYPTISEFADHLVINQKVEEIEFS
jgi:hypothetical protein